MVTVEQAESLRLTRVARATASSREIVLGWNQGKRSGWYALWVDTRGRARQRYLAKTELGALDKLYDLYLARFPTFDIGKQVWKVWNTVSGRFPVKKRPSPSSSRRRT
jgi:hypothetical protein